MSFNDYWKDKAAKRRKVWAATAKRFADEHTQLDKIRQKVFLPLDYNNTFSFEDYKATHFVEQNPIAVWEQMQFHFSENDLRNAMAAEGADLSNLAMQVSKESIVGMEAPCPKNRWDTDFYITNKVRDNESTYHAWQKRVYEICTDVETVRLTYGEVTMTIKRYSKEGAPFGYYELNPCEQLTKAAMMMQETDFNMLNVATLLMEMDATWKLRQEELNYYAKKLCLRTMEAVVADDSIDFTLWDDNKLAKKIEEYIAKGYTINQVIDQVLRPYKTAVKKYFCIATEQSIMTQNDTLHDFIHCINKESWVENRLRPLLEEAGMQDVDVSLTKHTTVLTKQGYSCCIKNRDSWQDGGFSPNTGYDNFSIDISTSTPMSAVVNFLGHMPTINHRVDEYIVKALKIYDNLMCRQNEEYNKIAQHLAALSAQHTGKPVGKLMKYLRWSTGNLMNKQDAFSRMLFHTIAVTGDTSFNFTAREMKSIVPLIYGDEFIKEKWIDAECSNVYSDNPEITDEQGWIKANSWLPILLRDSWKQDVRSFAGHVYDVTFLTVDFIDEKL